MKENELNYTLKVFQEAETYSFVILRTNFRGKSA